MHVVTRVPLPELLGEGEPERLAVAVLGGQDLFQIPGETESHVEEGLDTWEHAAARMNWCDFSDFVWMDSAESAGQKWHDEEQGSLLPKNSKRIQKDSHKAGAHPRRIMDSLIMVMQRPTCCCRHGEL
jgi:hypothetical protein